MIYEIIGLIVSIYAIVSFAFDLPYYLFASGYCIATAFFLSSEGIIRRLKRKRSSYNIYQD